MTKLICSIVLIIATFSTVHSQILPDTIPFTLNKQSNICIQATINGTDTLLLMFHSSNTGVTLTKEAVATMSTLKPGKATQVTSWGGVSDAAFSENNSLTISRLRWDSLTVFVDEYSGTGTDGKFGYDLFEGKIVAIDYDRSRMIVHSKLPALPKGYFKTNLFVKQGSTYIEGTLKLGKTIYQDTFMFHTGYGGAVLLDPKIGERFAVQDNLKTISVSELKDAFGNIIKIETKELPALIIGGKKLKNVPLSFAARSSPIPMKIFGNGLLKRFNVIFDFQRNEVYLKPNGFWKMPY